MGFRSYFTKPYKAHFLITKRLILWKLVNTGLTITIIEFHHFQPVLDSRRHLSPLVHKLLILTNPVIFRIMDLRKEILFSRNHFPFQKFRKNSEKRNHSIECINYDYFSFDFKCMYVASLGNIAAFFFF